MLLHDDARDVGEHVHTVVVLEHGTGELVDVLSGTQLERRGECVQPLVAQGPHLQLEFIGHTVRTNHRGPLKREGPRHSTTDAACGPGDDADATLEPVQVATRPPSISRPTPVVNELMSLAR